jgi:phage terminase large subunit-like protein
MGLRGPGAKPVKKQRSTPRGSKPSWQKPGLSRIQKVIAFVEALPITSGKFAGKKFKLRPWQLDILRNIYREHKGKRIVRTALLSMPRKNGKTGLTAALALCHLCGPEAVPRGQVYSAAAERKQAGLLYEEMKAMIAEVPWLNKRIVVRDFTKQLEDVDTGSVYFAISADAKTKHGFNISCWIYDELAQAKDRKLYDVLATSTGARTEPLGIVISTQSPDPRHIMSELVDYGIQVRDGIVPDPSFYASIYSAPSDADPWAEPTWYGCNPALGDFRDLDEMRDFSAKAQRIPAQEAAFRLMYLNQRIDDKESRLFSRADWDACGRPIDLSILKGRKCFGGLDLSKKNDLTALCLIFPFDDGSLLNLSHFWLPEARLEEAESRDRAPYRLWAQQGHLTATPGKIIDYAFIALKLAELTKLYDVQGVAADPYKLDYLEEELNKINVTITLLKHGQGFKDFSPAIEALEDSVLTWSLHHNNPVLTWCIDNIKVSMDSAGNRKFDKRKATGRIDGAVALAMACRAAKIQPAEPQTIGATIL